MESQRRRMTSSMRRPRRAIPSPQEGSGKEGPLGSLCELSCSLLWLDPVTGSFLLQLSCPCRQIQLCNPILSYPTLSMRELASARSQTDYFMIARKVLQADRALSIIPGVKCCGQLKSRLHLGGCKGVSCLNKLFEPRGYSHKRTTHHRRFASLLDPVSADSASEAAPYKAPRYLGLDFERHVQRNIPHFRLRTHTMGAEGACWQTRANSHLFVLLQTSTLIFFKDFLHKRDFHLVLPGSALAAFVAEVNVPTLAAARMYRPSNQR
eukprot:1151045-Pelagomonas_calceolata.AAC.10